MGAHRAAGAALVAITLLLLGPVPVAHRPAFLPALEHDASVASPASASAAFTPATSVLPAAPEALAPAVAARQRGRCASAEEALRNAAAEPTPTGARAAYLLASCLAASGRHVEARRIFEAVAGRHTTLAARARLGAARAALHSGDPAGAVRLSGPHEGVPAPASARLALVRGEALLRLGRPGEAAAPVRRVVADRGLTGVAYYDGLLAEAWWLLARAAEAAGDAAAARSAYAMVWWGIPGSSDAPAAAQRLRVLSRERAPIPTAQARAWRGLRLLQQWERQAAERELALAVKGPPGDLAGEVWYQLGLLRLGMPAGASALAAAARYPRDRDRALYWLGVARLRIGQQAEARTAWEGLRREYPASLWTARAIATQGRLAESGGRWQEADRLYALVIERYPTSSRADESRWRRAWMRYRRGQHAEARALFVRYATSAPEAPRAPAHLYWAARLAASGGAGTAGSPRSGTASRSAVAVLFRDAAQRYPLTFYGQRARARLGLPPAPPPHEGAPVPLASDRFHPVHEELAALGSEDEALEEIAAAVTDDAPPDLRRAAADLYMRAGDVSRAVQVLEPLIEEALFAGISLDGATWRLAYPRPHWSAVVREARRQGIDPRLVLAVMREESRFDARAVSTANAVGLMQLLPSTARGVLGRSTTVEALKEPDVNIRAGAAYLAGLLRRSQGSVPLAVAAYNAGPGGVRRHAALARVDLDRFVEEFPYAETRAYVQRVMQTYGIYRWLYP